MRYELTDLRLFYAIAEAQNLSAGAESLFMSASAASYRVKNLEKSMGVSLFDRSAQGMRLTHAGEGALDFVREILSTAEQLDAEIQGYVSGTRGLIRLVANSSSLNGFLLPALGDFLVRAPSVDLEIRDLPSREIVDEIAEGRAEMGILAAPQELSAVEAVPFGTDEMILVCSASHPLAEAGQIEFYDALDFDFVSVDRGNSNFLFLAATARHADKTLRVRLYAPGFESVLAAVATGAGIALVPRSVARDQLALGAVRGVQLRDEWAERQLTLITRKQVTQPHYVEWLKDHLLTAVRTRASDELTAVSPKAPRVT